MKCKIQQNGISSTIDMTPMIDIVFQLILFFLVSTTFALLPAIKLNLPLSKTASGENSKGITILMTENNDIYFNEKKVDIDSLKTELIEYDVKDIERQAFPIVIEAESEVTNGKIVNIFDIIRESGFSVINLRTATKK
ncbi:MAG: biopolymer transporter ExbD [Treponema sp.]|nr:biopolymer transporter ExbD [Treponema sp.]